MQVTQAPPPLDTAAKLLGGQATAAVASNFQLKGVIIASDANESVAILSSNGKPEQAVRTNAEAAPGVTVKEINPSYVLLSEGGVSKRVELPKNAKRK